MSRSFGGSKKPIARASDWEMEDLSAPSPDAMRAWRVQNILRIYRPLDFNKQDLAYAAVKINQMLDRLVAQGMSEDDAETLTKVQLCGDVSMDLSSEPGASDRSRNSHLYGGGAALSIYGKLKKQLEESALDFALPGAAAETDEDADEDDKLLIAAQEIGFDDLGEDARDNHGTAARDDDQELHDGAANEVGLGSDDDMEEPGVACDEEDSSSRTIGLFKLVPYVPSAEEDEEERKCPGCTFVYDYWHELVETCTGEVLQTVDLDAIPSCSPHEYHVEQRRRLLRVDLVPKSDLPQ